MKFNRVMMMVVGLSFFFSFLGGIHVSQADWFGNTSRKIKKSSKVKVPKTPEEQQTQQQPQYEVVGTQPTATVVPVEDPYEWSNFQDVAILPGIGNTAHIAFAVRKGRLKNNQYAGNTKLGLWQGWQDRDANWHARGVFRELTDYITSIRELNFRASTLANSTPVDTLTACQDEAKNSHIFVQVFQMSPQGMDQRLIYVRYTPQGNYKVKLSSTLSDDMGHSMQCVVDPANNVHLFGVKRWNQDYSRIVSYLLPAEEQTRIALTFQMARTELPQNFETGDFTVFRSSQGVDLAFFKQNYITLSLARHPLVGRNLAGVGRGWNLLFDNNASPEHQPNLMHDELHGFSYGQIPQTHIIGKYKNVRANGGMDYGIAYYYQEDAGWMTRALGGMWKSKGMVMNVNLYTLSVAAMKERPVFYMLGTTQDAEVWSGYYHARDQRWVNQGIVFRRNSQ